MARKLVVEIVGDSKSYERALKKSATATSQFGQAMGTTSPQLSKLSKGMALTGQSSVFLAGAAGGLAVAIGAKSVSAASDLNEEISKSAQVFGESSKEIKSWSETTATAMGISQTEALRATGTFGALFKTLAIGETQNAKLSKSLVGLASDMASFNNANPEDVLLALRSGLTGEAEPLRRFGVFLSEARTQQVALTQTGKTSIKTLTNQEKVLARYSIIMRDTASAQGDFGRTSGGLANQQRILRAQVTNLEASLGRVLLPTVTAVVGALNDAITAGQQTAAVLGKLADITGIDIPINFVFGGGRGASFFQDWILGHISPVALGIKIGHDIVFGTQQGINDGPVLDFSAIMPGELPGLPPLPGVVPILPPVQQPRTFGPLEQLEEQRKAQAKAFAAQRAIARAAHRANATSNQQLAESETRAAHLRELIRADPNNAKLGKRLTDELIKQATLQASIKSDAKSAAAAAKSAAADAVAAAKAARAAILGGFDLRAAQAEATKSLKDNLAVAKDREKTLRRMVSLHKKDLDLANELVDATAARRDIEKDIAENTKKRKLEKQFLALGLTKEGDKITPSAGALLKRATGIQTAFKGTILDTPKTKSQLKKIVAFLKANLKGAGKEIRDAILGLLNDIENAGDSKTGPLTKTAGLNTKKVLEGLGLTPEQERELRGRLAHGTAAAKAVAGNRTTAAAVLPGQRGPAEPFALESTVIVNLDGTQVARVVTKQQQKAGRRNPKQKRGPNSDHGF